MKRSILSCTLLLCILSLSAQQQFSDYSSQRRMLPMSTLPDIEEVEDVQKKFIRQQWSPGTVVLNQTNSILNYPLLFDVYSNQLYYLQKGQIMEFVPSSVKEFTISLLQKKDTVHVLYRALYPAIEKNNEEIFYEVMVDGKFQLLKCRAKTIYLNKQKDVPEEQRTAKKEMYFAYLPSGKLVQVKPDKEYLQKQMQDYASNIESISSDKKIKYKKEESLVQLFTLLNN